MDEISFRFFPVPTSEEERFESPSYNPAELEILNLISPPGRSPLSAALYKYEELRRPSQEAESDIRRR